ncbi:LTA synthase family protein [Succinimonas sp.]|uniref:LTA synthase family protein n=1 Tax=Succinimonas sp. TaxID=1936151 RepID=UPI003863E9BD
MKLSSPNIKEIIYFILLLFLSLLLSHSVFEPLKKSILLPIDGANNSILINLTYLLKDGDITLKSYDQNNILQHNTSKKITLKKHTITDNNQKEEFIDFESYEIDIPILNSHKIEIELNTDNNLAYIDQIIINNRSISFNDFITHAKSTSKLHIGKFKDGASSGIVIGSEDKNTVIDITNVLNPVKLTTEELKQINDEQLFYNFLLRAFCFITIFLICYIISISLKAFNRESYRPRFIIILIFFALVFSITNSYYLLFENSFQNSNAFFEDETNAFLSVTQSNILKFLQNFATLICLLCLVLTSIFFIKNRIIKSIIAVSSLMILTVLLVDNCLLNVLSVRLNFNMAGHAGETKYFDDFIYSYLISDSGLLMCTGFITFVITSFSGMFITIEKASLRKLASYLSIPVASLTLWGVYPTDPEEFKFTYLNPFQVNGFCFQKMGNFYNTYSDNYSKRNNLTFDYKTEQGLNQKKNIILVLVESLGCNFTYICGTGPAKMPYIESLAKNNAFFDNYYSIMPSTSLSLLSIIKSAPVIHIAWDLPVETETSSSISSFNKSYSRMLHSQNDLIRSFKSNNYKTSFISSTDHVFAMNEIIKQTNFDEVIDTSDPGFANIKERFSFNSVSDQELFKFIVTKIKSENDKPFFYVTKTATNHAPFNSPLGFNNLDKAFEYTDQEVYRFVKQLEAIDYFKNGIVILVGDHHAWGADGAKRNNSEPTFINKVPLIIIDGKNQGSVNHTQFSHASLGVLLQYLELPTYKFNQFNTNPLVDNAKPEIIFGYDFGAMTYLEVKKDDRSNTIILDGDDSYFKDDNIFTPEEMDEILGYVAYFRM